MIEIMTMIALGALVLGFDCQIANTMSRISREFGELCRRLRVWGTLSKPSDPQMSYRDFLFFVRFLGPVMVLQGVCLFLLTC
jgi:hypothetical protein